MACCFSENAPLLEDFLPPDPDNPRPVELKVDNAMRKVGGKSALNPDGPRAVRTAEDEEFVRRVNAKVMGTE